LGFISLLAALTVAGCAERRAAGRYESLVDRLPPGLQRKLAPPLASPQVVEGNTPDRARELAEANLALVGVVDLGGAPPDDAWLQRQARQHGAEVIQVSRDFARERDQVLRLVVNGAVAGQDDAPPAEPLATDLAGRTPAFRIPLDPDPPRTGAFFWRRLKPRTLGVILDEPWLGKTATGDKGALVKLVVRGSPAERAHLRAGDIIVAVGETPVPDYRALAELLPSLAGTHQPLQVVRQHQSLSLPVAFGGGS
jgi:hypothetical protein